MRQGQKLILDAARDRLVAEIAYIRDVSSDVIADELAEALTPEISTPAANAKA